MFHPWELSLSEKEGVVSGKLLRIDSVYRTGVTKSELEIVELPVSSPQDLRKELDAEREQARIANKRAKPPVIMVFAPSASHLWTTEEVPEDLIAHPQNDPRLPG